MRVTRPNLLSWYDTRPDVDAFPVFRSDCRTGSLITYVGELTGFYLNLITPLATSGPLDVTVSLVPYRPSSDFTLVVANLNVDQINPVDFALYGSLTCPNVPIGLYRWRIVAFGTTYYSTLIEVMSQTDARSVSIHCQFAHSKTIQGIRYPWVDSDFTQSARFRANLTDTPFAVEESVYRESTTAKTVPYNSAQDRILSFRVEYTDRDILAGIAVMLVHDNILINGQSVTTKEHLATQPAGGHLMPGTFSVIDNEFAYPLIG